MDRYRAIVDDWEAFRTACQRPLPAAARRNPLKAGPDFVERLREAFPDARRTDWNPDLYRLGPAENPGKTVLHWRGEYYVQEESAALPVEVLDPRPGEAVLDLCAAPGGKTTQVAAKLGNRGLVVANDVSPKRIRSLMANVYRTGSACVSVTRYDGRNLSEGQTYDRVLVDAPCSNEGNRARRDFQAAPRALVRKLVPLQRALLTKAARLLKPGGVLVYATCTFAPEENEAVVADVLEGQEGLQVEAVPLPVPHQPGVTRFEGREYGSELERTVRVYPHHIDSGGIFLAKLRG